MRALGLRVALSSALLVSCLLGSPPVPREAGAQAPRARERSAAAVARLEREVVDRVNRVRAEHTLQPLEPDAELASIARAHSCRMAREGFFAHAPPTGGSVADRLREAGREFRAVAENIARTRGVPDPAADVVEGWLRSEGHLDNLLRRTFTHTGVGVCTEGPGYYFTQVFLEPR